VLTHELGHVCLGHRDTTPRNETLADRWAALHLIDPDALRRAAKATDDLGAWCHELNVSADILDRWLLDHRRAS
jgi:Zn-dependent peptidase ImmA (M78 family)